jgi:ABC-type transport system involved in multi-copper enzyme maturation permease subunit
MNDFKKFSKVTMRHLSQRLFSTRMAIMLPILILFIPGMAWGFSDPKVLLPGGISPSSATEVMFYTSLGIVFGATMCSVLLSFDGVSKDRASGLLEIKLAQPMPRTHQSTALVIGHWFAILIPTWILWAVSFVIVKHRMGDWPSIVDVLTSFISVALILLWYVLFSLIASSHAKEQGTSIAFGVGVWFLFTFLWALVTTMIAFASGISIGEENNPKWIGLEGVLDLFSPNGVFHHLLETRLNDVDRGVSPLVLWLVALLWSVIPWYWFNYRMKTIQP